MMYLTQEQHAEHEHLCGKKGYAIFPEDCRECKLKIACRQEHCIIGVDCI